MTRLEDFLALPDVANEMAEVTLKRLGTIKFKPMTNEQYNSYSARCRGKFNKNGVTFDSNKFSMLVICNQCVEPDFSNAAFLQQAGCQTPEDFINKKLLPGEITDIANAISKASGFDIDNIDEKIDEAKNS